MCFTLALTFFPLPQERKWRVAGFGFADNRPANPGARRLTVRQIKKQPERFSHSGC
jgi:hypothetical protein